MSEIQRKEAGRNQWLTALMTAGRTFAVVMGTAGLGLVGGLSYGAWMASQTPRTSGADDFFVSIAWVIGLTVYGAIGFVGGLVAGLLVLVLTWIVRLAKRIVRSWAERKATRT